MSSSSTTSVNLDQLKRGVDGRVTVPGDAGYDQARKVFYGKWDRRPAAVVRPAGAEEVARVVTLAAESGAELAVRSGGHSLAGHSVSDGGIVLDLSEMTALDIDLEGRTAWAQTGLTAGAYTLQVGEHGLVTGFGDIGSVGIGGITLGGGVGFLVRRHGLTVDSLLGAELVTADGQVLQVDDEHHPDLFWAIRGGGGNFGVATRLKFRLHELPSIVGGMLLLPGSPEVIEGLVAEATAAPEELSVIANIMVAPPMPFLPAEAHGKLVVMALLAYAGEAEAGERALAPFRALAEPVADMVQPMPYAGLFQGADDEFEVVEESARSLFMDAVDAAAAEAVIEHLGASTAPMAVTQLRVLGGAMARVPVDATAFAHRHRRIMAGVGSVYEQAADRGANDAWADRFAAALRQGDPGVYVNFLGDEGPDRVRQAYPGATWDRLVEVKRRYDPGNLFRRNQNIPPGPA
ncbi:MAG TPA: FAD-binding oxidoreductase [Actinomycetes bacterium]|nr:FAD-binding oxidoreductase [Actinomycetes bacterium]